MFFVLYFIIVFQVFRTGCLASGNDNANTQTHFQKEFKKDDRFYLNEDDEQEENQNSTVNNLKSNFFDKMLSDEMLSMHKHIYDKSHEIMSVSILNKNNVPTPTLELKQKWLSMDLFTKQEESIKIDALDSEHVPTEQTKQNTAKEFTNNVIDYSDELIKVNNVMKDKKRNMEFAAFNTNFPVSVGTHVKRRHYDQKEGVKVCSCKNTCTRKSSCCSSKKTTHECTHKPDHKPDYKPDNQLDYKPIPFTIITPLNYPYSNNFFTKTEKAHHKHKHGQKNDKWDKIIYDYDKSKVNYNDDNKDTYVEKIRDEKFDENDDIKYEENKDSKYDENEDRHGGNNDDSGNDSNEVLENYEETDTIQRTENINDEFSPDDNQLIENILEDMKFKNQPKSTKHCYCNSSQHIGITDALYALLFITLMMIK